MQHLFDSVQCVKIQNPFINSFLCEANTPSSLNFSAQLNIFHMVNYRAFHKPHFLSVTLDGTSTHSSGDCPTQGMQTG